MRCKDDSLKYDIDDAEIVMEANSEWPSNLNIKHQSFYRLQIRLGHEAKNMKNYFMNKLLKVILDC